MQILKVTNEAIRSDFKWKLENVLFRNSQELKFFITQTTFGISFNDFTKPHIIFQKVFSQEKFLRNTNSTWKYFYPGIPKFQL